MSKPELRVVSNNDDLSPHTITVQGLSVPVSKPYASGHICTEAEAEVLNQTRIENLRNNFASRIKKALGTSGLRTAEMEEALRSEFISYERTYVFGLRKAAAPELSALAKESQKIAKGMVLEALRRQSIDPRTISSQKMTEMVVALIRRRPDIEAEAQRRVDRARELTVEALDLEPPTDE